MTKFAIGCLVQWYESEIIDEYLDTLEQAVKVYDGEVIVDVCLIVNEELELIIKEVKILNIFL